MAHRIRIPDGLYAKLAERADPIGIAPGDYIVYTLIRLVSGEIGGSDAAPSDVGARRPGRPVTVVAEDLPAGVERDASVSGFTGVTRDGKFWKARLGREVVGGRFSTPEIAAIARHYAQVGFKLGRGAFFGAQGLPLETAIDLAAKAGFSPVALEVDAGAAEGGGDTVDGADAAVPPRRRGRKPAGASLLFDDDDPGDAGSSGE